MKAINLCKFSIFCLNQDLSVYRIGELLGVSEAKQADDHIKAKTWNQAASSAELTKPEKGSFYALKLRLAVWFVG